MTDRVEEALEKFEKMQPHCLYCGRYDCGATDHTHLFSVPVAKLRLLCRALRLALEGFDHVWEHWESGDVDRAFQIRDELQALREGRDD